MVAERTTTVGVLDRAVQVLDAVDGGARSFTSIVAVTGLTRSTAHRLIRALEDHALLMHVDGHGYVLGPRVLELGASAARELPLRQVGRPVLEGLARATRESAQLYVRVGDRRVCVDAVESSQELRTIVEVGASLPLDRGSAAKVFLAWADDADLDRLLTGTPARERLLRQLPVVRRRGWADSHGERETGVASVSAPVRGPGGTLVAAVSVSGPERRVGTFRAADYAPEVMDAALTIERALGVQG
jgi:DNA-binding IclR family transcriptional regulator